MTLFKKTILKLTAGVAVFAGATFSSLPLSLAQTLGAAAPSSSCVELSPIDTASMYIRGSSGGSELRSGDPVGPFPLSTILPFPWKSIDGIWSVPTPSGKNEYFSFQVQDACDGNGGKVVKVQRFNEVSYAVTAEGVGLGLANDTMVRAIMTSKDTQYMVFVRQFSEPVSKTKNKITTVITTRPFDGNEGGDVHSYATQVSSLTLEKMVRKTKKQREAVIRGRSGGLHP